MKRLIISILSISMLLAITACSSSNTPASDKNDKDISTETNEVQEVQETKEENTAAETMSSLPDIYKEYTHVNSIFGYYQMHWCIGNQSIGFFCDKDGNIAALEVWQCWKNTISDDVVQKFNNDSSYGVAGLGHLTITFYPQIILALNDEKKAEVDELIRNLFSFSEDPEIPLLEMINRAKDEKELYSYIESISQDADKIANMGIEAENIAVYDPSIGSITVMVDNLNVRTEPSTTADTIGTVSQAGYFGDSPDQAYDVVEAEGYTWYKIGEGEWIASKDDWVTYMPYGEH